MKRPGSAPAARSLSAPSSGWELRVIKAKERLDALHDAGVKPASWNSRDVGDWLEIIGLPQYRNKSIAQGIDGSVLIDFVTTCQRHHIPRCGSSECQPVKKDLVVERQRERMFEQLGIRNLAHQMLFMNKASDLKAQELSLQVDDSILETPSRIKTATLLERHQNLQRRRSCLKDMQEVLDDLVKQSVFVNLQHFVDVLHMEGGSDLVKQSVDCIGKLKAKLADCKTKLLEEERLINTEKVKALRISDRRGADLLAGVSPPKVSQHKALSTDQCEKLVERLHPDPEKVKRELRQRAKQEERDWKLRIGIKESTSPQSLSMDQCEKLIERLHPDPVQKDWRMRIGTATPVMTTAAAIAAAANEPKRHPCQDDETQTSPQDECSVRELKRKTHRDDESQSSRPYVCAWT